MNNIRKLKLDIVESNYRIVGLLERIHELRSHLQSSKFGPQADGSRGDWMSVADIQNWLRYIEDPNLDEERYGPEA
jgi:hypothetical protein